MGVFTNAAPAALRVLQFGRGRRHQSGRLRQSGPGQRAIGRHLVLDLGQRGEGGHGCGQPGGLDPVPGQRHDRDLLLHREQHVGPAPHGDVEGGLQPAERIAAEGRDVVNPPHVPGHPAQAQPRRGQRLHLVAGPGQHGRALPGGQPGPVAQQYQHDRLRLPARTRACARPFQPHSSAARPHPGTLLVYDVSIRYILILARADAERDAAVGRAPQISREAVLDAALRLADEQGLDAVTMHAVARRLQVTPMALYRHVDDKNALLDGLVEMLLTEYPLPRAEGEWDERLTALADGIRDTARRHPAVFPLLLTRPAVTPAARVVRDAVQAALREGGLPEAEVARAERLISTAVLGFAASEASGRFRQHDQSVIDADFAELLRWLRLVLS